MFHSAIVGARQKYFLSIFALSKSIDGSSIRRLEDYSPVPAMMQLVVRLILASSLLRHIDASVCELIQCQNSGLCVEGSTDSSEHHFIEDESVIETYGGIASEAHCQCEPGWTGLTCEVPYHECSNNHIC